MKQGYRNILSIFLTVLILFSTIGVNIINTFCSGCNDEHISITMMPLSQHNEICECCNETDNSESCCPIDTHDQQHKMHHRTTSTFAHLNINATEAKSVHLQTVIIIIQLTATMLDFVQAQVQPQLRNTNRPPNFIQTGREILTNICIMRN